MKRLSREKELKWGLILGYIATAVGLISSLVLNPIIIRNLGQNEYGLYEAIGSFVNYLAILDLGFSSVVVRYVALYEGQRDYVKRDEFLYVARRIYQALAIAVLLIGGILYFFIDPVFGNAFSAEELRKAHLMYVIVLFTTALSIYSQVYGGALTGIENFVFPRIIRILKIVLAKVVAIIVVVYGGDSIGYTIVLLAFEIFCFITYKAYCSSFVKFKKKKIVFSEIKELLVFTSFILMQAIAAQLYWQIDKVVLGSMIGTAIVAVYSVALNLQSVIQNVSDSIKGMLLPKATHLAINKSDENSIQPFMEKSGRFILMIYGIAYIGMICFGKEFISLWLGYDYSDAYGVYLIIGTFGMIPTVLGIGETVCRAYNKHQFLSRITIIAAFINLALTIIGAKYFGYIGAAYATAIGLLIGNTIIPLYYYRKIFPFSAFKFLLNLFKGIWGALLVSALSGFLLNHCLTDYSWITLIIKSIGVCMAYFICMMFFGFSDFEKKTVISTIKRG